MYAVMIVLEKIGYKTPVHDRAFLQKVVQTFKLFYEKKHDYR